MEKSCPECRYSDKSHDMFEVVQLMTSTSESITVRVVLGFYTSFMIFLFPFAFVGRKGLNRCAKSCRLRWLNYLRPGIK